MMNDPLTVVLDRLRGLGIEPAVSGNGYSVCCPAHEDRSPSLTIGIGDDGRVLVHCKAGCSFDAVLAALRLEPKDLFPESASASTSRRSPGRTADKPKETFPSAEAAVAAWEKIRRAKLVGRWDYHDADGRHVFSEVRFPPPRPGERKIYHQVALAADGTWFHGLPPAPRAIYRLPAVLAADGPVYVVEGCKAADSLVSLGLTATTSPCGALSPGKADWSPLRGRRVVIVPDHDEPGERYAADVVDLALRAGAGAVVVVRLIDLWPGLPEHGDAHDWIEAHDAVDAVDLREGLEALVAKAEPVAAAAAEPDEDDEVIEWQPFPSEQLPNRSPRSSRKRPGASDVTSRWWPCRCSPRRRGRSVTPG
jgi:putative DNA primase/helicase